MKCFFGEVIDLVGIRHDGDVVYVNCLFETRGQSNTKVIVKHITAINCVFSTTTDLVFSCCVLIDATINCVDFTDIIFRGCQGSRVITNFDTRGPKSMLECYDCCFNHIECHNAYINTFDYSTCDSVVITAKTLSITFVRAIGLLTDHMSIKTSTRVDIECGDTHIDALDVRGPDKPEDIQIAECLESKIVNYTNDFS